MGEGRENFPLYSSNWDGPHLAAIHDVPGPALLSSDGQTKHSVRLGFLNSVQHTSSDLLPGGVQGVAVLSTFSIHNDSDAD